ncbi:HAD-IB family hydrolase [Miniphocaeibacter massiliensis]|uniref:HAD-IB family hydrolase n=1 Tax=Miniphocaeibacter massiliensis TaxID=2041841 RepID=UPI000C089B2E|nr:HAD-IB family hydrolase [Miniphocaeibacter massiliensis]
MDKRIAAFFDIDGTLARESLMIDHFKKLVKYDIISQTIWLEKIKPFWDAYSKRYDEYDSYSLVMADAYKEGLIGFNSEFNEHISKQVVKNIGEIVYKYTRNRINYHKENNHLIFFISGSPDFLVKEMANIYNVTEYRATKYVLDENLNYTGEIIPMWDSDSKKKEVEKLVDKYNIDISNSYSYGDTSGDLSMLKLTGNSVAINPIKELIKKINEDNSLKNKVEIIVERKDVIYSINSQVKILDI